jgi:polar amino acid transport system substrate-binding protein
MKTITFALIALSLSVFSTFSHSTTYKVAAYTWEPFIGPGRSDGGISIKLLREIMLSQGHNIEVVPMSWSKALAVTEQGDADILPAVWLTEERTVKMTYSKPYASNRIVFVKSKDDSYEYTDIASLDGKTVGIIDKYAYNEEFLANDNIRFSKSSSVLNNVKKVAGKRIDLTLDDEIVLKTIIPLKVLEQVAFTKNALSEKPLYITCYKTNSKCDDIISSFNKGLKEMQDNGELAKVLKKLGL